MSYNRYFTINYNDKSKISIRVLLIIPMDTYGENDSLLHG